MTVLNALVPALKREVAVPGTFDDVFPDTGRSDLIGSLADGFSQAKLEGGWFGDVVLDITDPDNTVWATTPDLSDAGGALVVIYSASQILHSLLRNAGQGSTAKARYKAGPVEYETEAGVSATVLRAELDYLTERKQALIAQGTTGARTCSARQVDGYLARVACGPVYPNVGGFFPYEYRG